jgi:hypothetical protein
LINSTRERPDSDAAHSPASFFCCGVLAHP